MSGEHWVWRPLGEIIELRRGFELAVSTRTPGPFNVISAGASAGTHTEWKILGPGFAIGRATNLGRPQWSATDYWPLNTTLYAADFRGNNPRWLFHLFETLDLTGFNSGSAQPMLNRNYIASVPVLVPPRTIQDAIAEVLGALDDKIAANRRVLKAAELLQGALVMEARGGAPRVPLGSLMDLKYGKALPSGSRMPGSVSVVGSGGVIGQHDTPLLEGPSVIVGRKGTVGAVYWVDGPSFPIDTAFWVEPKQDIPLVYLFHLLDSIDLTTMSSDSAVPGLNRHDAYALEVPLPTRSVLESLSEAAAPAAALTAALIRENTVLASTRDELLPLLMNGKITVRDAELVAEEVL